MPGRRTRITVTFVALLALASIAAGCRHPSTTKTTPPSPSAVLGTDALAPSPRLIIGRIVAIDLNQGFAFVELARDAPAAALSEGTELIARTLELRETARLGASRYLRGRTLGTNILGGQPSPGNEVVWLAP